MTLYSHYKNKPYKYLGIVRHSETLEEMVLYQCRYENKLGKMWVRPKEMFFESVVVDGEKKPRFEKIDIKVIVVEPANESDIQSIVPVFEKLFGKWKPDSFYPRFNQYQKRLLVLTKIDNKIVGFKIGYGESNEIFYSWLGGVDPDYQGVGIASELLKMQHKWCQENGFKKVRTKTRNKFKSMLILNLNSGFQIVETASSDDGDIKIVLEKTL